MYQLRQSVSALKPTRLGVLFAALIGFGVGFWQWMQPPRPRVVLQKFGEFSALRVYFSADARKLVTVHHKEPPDIDYYYLTLWDVQTGQKEFDFFEGRAPALADPQQDEERRRLLISEVVFSPNGQRMACIFEKHIGLSEVPEKQIRVWDVASGHELATFKEREAFPQLVFSSENELLVLRQDSDLWNVTKNKVVKTLVLGGEEVIGRGDKTILVRSQDDIIKVWNLATGTLVAERRDIMNLWKDEENFLNFDWSSDRCLVIHRNDGTESSIIDLITGQKKEFPVGPTGDAAISPDGQTIALGEFVGVLQQKSWWSVFLDWLGIQGDSLDNYVTVAAFPSGKEIIVLKGYRSPLFSPDGRILAVRSNDGSLELWDLPIRKPIGKILGLAALAAVATLLAFNGLGWLRRRRMRLKAKLVPNSVPSTK